MEFHHNGHNQKRKLTEPCRFHLQRNCKYGDSCRFSHVRGKYDSSGNNSGRMAENQGNYGRRRNHHQKLQRSNPWKRVWTRKVGKRGDFKLMCLNLLAKSLVETEKYSYCLDFISWEYRWKLLLQHVKEMDCDILCLQEVDEVDFNGKISQDLLLLGFEGVYKKRTRDKKDGCAIYYKIKKFKAVADPIKVEFYQKERNERMDRDNIAIGVVLEHMNKSEGTARRVLVATTHILFNPKRGDIKLMQLDFLMRQLQQKSALYKAPVIICGDFNSTPDSAIYHWLFSKDLNMKELDRRYMSGQGRVSYKLSRFGKQGLKFDRNGHKGSGSFLGKHNSRTPKSKDSVDNTSKACDEDKDVDVSEVCDDDTDKTQEGDTDMLDMISAKDEGFNPRKIPFSLPEYLHNSSNKLDLSSAMAVDSGRRYTTGEPAFTSFHSSFTGTVDYIGYEHSKIQLCAILELPKPQAFFDSFIPSKEWGSDHFSLLAEFSLSIS